MCMVGQTQGGTMAQIGASMARKKGDEVNAQKFDAVAANERVNASAGAAPQLAQAKAAFRPDNGTVLAGGSARGKTLLGQ